VMILKRRIRTLQPLHGFSQSSTRASGPAVDIAQEQFGAIGAYCNCTPTCVSTMPPNIIERAAEHCVTSKFEHIFDNFARYAAVIASGRGEEWKLFCTQAV
jgi:hypothetical protein